MAAIPPIYFSWDGESMKPRQPRLADKCAIEGCGKPILARGWCSAHYNRWRKHGDPVGGGVAAGVPQAFVRQAALYTGNDCTEWPFGRYPNGYGKVWWDGRHQVASRIVCELAHGKPPSPEHEAAHSCGKGHNGCVTPQHLRWATPAENMADRVQHGTANRGERHGIARLSSADVLEIRERVSRGEAQARIAQDFGVNQTAISRIKRGECWGWLTEVGK